MTTLLDPNPVPYRAAEFTRDRENRAVLSPRNVTGPTPDFTGLALLKQINDFFAMREQIQQVAEGVARQARMQEIKDQLAPGQSVVVFERGQPGEKKTISITRDLPGQGYLFDPDQVTATKVSQPLDYCPLPDSPTKERRSFTVEGSKIELQRDANDLDLEKIDQFDRRQLRQKSDDNEPMP